MYLDFASATPMLPRAARAMARAASRFPGNPSASHAEGRAAFNEIFRARAAIARSLAVKPDELTFTSGGTESNNLAIRGFIEALRRRGFSYADLHVISTTIEHSSVTKALRLLEAEGVSVSWVAPGADGIVDVQAILRFLKPNTVLVTLAHVNSEIGVIEPIAAIADKMKKAPYERDPALTVAVPEVSFPVVHADAAQSPLYLDAGPHALHADMVSYDAQKIMGPKGVGVLYRDFSVPLEPITGGGSQERGLRSGTENTAAIVGAGIAFEYARAERQAREKKITALREALISRVLEAMPDALLMGSRAQRVANNACFAIPGIDGDYLAVLMDKEGVAVTPRSACIGSGAGYSEVVYQLTKSKSLAKGTIRFSLGPTTTKKDIHRAVFALASLLKGNALRPPVSPAIK